MKKYLFITVALFGFRMAVIAQVSTISPEKPSVTDEIAIGYNCTDANASLNGREPVYARITTCLRDGATNNFHVLMAGTNGRLAAQFKLPVSAASFKVEFYTLNKDDDKAGFNKLVYKPNHQTEVEGAYMAALFDDNPDSIFRKELVHYPDNYLAWAKFINVVAMIKDHAAGKAQVEGLIKKLTLSIKASNHPDAGLLAALCIGNAKTGNLAEGKKYLYQLFSKFPENEETAFAFSIYNYEYYKSSRKDVEEDIRTKLKEIFIAHPEAGISRDINVFYYIKDDRKIPVATFEKVLLPQYENDKVSYYALTSMPELYIDRNEKLDSAGRMLKKAIALFQSGGINHRYRLNYSHYQQDVPLMYMDLAKIDLARKNYQDAVTNSSAGIALLTGGSAEGNFMPLLLQLRANAYKQAGNANLAMEDYRKLYKYGVLAALDSMKMLFPFCSLKQKTFAEFVTSLKPSGAQSTTAEERVPDFTASDLAGKPVHLSDFKGKLVVLNIWSIGCGPCIAEMPELNKLVKQFSSQPNVVFIALSGDKTENLVKFLKSREFNYRVLNNAPKLADSFQTNALPVHMVIGKNGEVISQSIGARDNIRDFLQQVINANL
ncbi:TlpA family protein disulfide reductase [Mucilaginibacter xinganensis]|uniref:Thioredoxin domain-containing protein n=1 Tax=Mucilaginibacter xinganensis TaxID=1234841 RepID=A0A223P058_9SPHI|nr:TlpA disulfide reductase family protein [Mucilaginibacter xinganensis]ASU35503.1 hypothetical protein MuYL_3618 [Mucilaginibacter xinganensis]